MADGQLIAAQGRFHLGRMPHPPSDVDSPPIDGSERFVTGLRVRALDGLDGRIVSVRASDIEGGLAPVRDGRVSAGEQQRSDESKVLGAADMRCEVPLGVDRVVERCPSGRRLPVHVGAGIDEHGDYFGAVVFDATVGGERQMGAQPRAIRTTSARAPRTITGVAPGRTRR